MAIAGAGAKLWTKVEPETQKNLISAPQHWTQFLEIYRIRYSSRKRAIEERKVKTSAVQD